jgi:hypothetical protein
LAEEKFAADLGQVVYGSDKSVYGVADEFFKKTYPTDGLEKLLSNLMQQVAERSGSSIIDLDTSFGGGKTHNLIAAYHFLADPEAIEEPGRFVDEARFEQYVKTLSNQPARVAAFVGTDVDALDASMADDELLTSPKTIWGELAYRLEGSSGYEIIQEYDERRIAPGKGTFGKVLNDDTHYVLLLDELAEYLAGTQTVEADTETDESSEVDNLADSTLSFFNSVLQYASTEDNLTVLYTIADTAFGDKAEEVRAVVDELDAIGKRKEWNITPTDDDEIAPVIAKRLFDDINPEAAKQVATAYDERLFSDPDNPVSVAERDSDYAERIAQSYPFHPATIDVLTQKVDSLAGFQKTRGALRLLSRAVYRLWKDRPERYDRHLIRPYDLSLGDSEIRAEAQDLFEAVDLEPARTTDIWNPTHDAHAQIEDRNRARDGLPPLGSHLATTIFWHSLSFATEDTQRGVTHGELQVAVAHPQVRLDKYEDSLDNLTYRGGLNTETACYFLHSDDNLYRFSAEATPSRILAEERDEVRQGEIREEIEERVSGLKRGIGGFEVCTPEAPYDLPDKKQNKRPSEHNPQLAVMHHESAAVDSGDEAPSKLDNLHQYADDDGDPRVYKNNVIFLVADTEKRRDAEDTVRKLLAREAVLSKDKYDDVLSPEQREEIEDLRDRLLVDTAIKQIYRHLYYPDDNSLSHIFLKDVDVTNHDSFEEIVLDAFDESGDPIALDASAEGRAAFYIQPRFFNNDVFLDTEEFVDRFRRNTNVPILLSVEPIKDTVVKCCQDDTDQFGFGYVDSSGTGYYDVEAAERAGVDPAESDAYENLHDAARLSRHDVEISEDARLYADVEAFIENEGEASTCENCGNPTTDRYCEDCLSCAEDGCHRTLDPRDIGQHEYCETHRGGPPTCPADGCDNELGDTTGFCRRHQNSLRNFRANDAPMGVLRALSDLRDGLRSDGFDHGVPVLDRLSITFTGNNAWDDAYDFVDYLDDPFSEVEAAPRFEYKYYEDETIRVDCTVSGELEEMGSSRPITRSGGEQQLELSVDIEGDKVVGEDSLADSLIASLQEQSDTRGNVIVEADAHNATEGAL